jgi:hypothetical protein
MRMENGFSMDFRVLRLSEAKCDTVECTALDDFRLATWRGEHGVKPRPVDDGALRHGQLRPSWSNVQLCRPPAR